jgi:hypothetical protein
MNTYRGLGMVISQDITKEQNTGIKTKTEMQKKYEKYSRREISQPFPKLMQSP